MPSIVRANALIIVLILALILRMSGINWDQGYHLHPDERMLIMVSDQVHLFTDLNPNFFNYGSLPVYLLKGVAQLSDFLFSTQFANYTGLLTLGRLLSVGADILTLIFIYKIGVLLFKREKPAILSSLLYAIAFFPIQNSHFFVVDVYLTMFVTILLYHLIRYLEEHDFNRILYLSVISGAILATKVTGVVFVGVVWIVIALHGWIKYRNSLMVTALALTIFSTLTIAFHFLFMPYAYLSYTQFIHDILQQAKMNSNPYIFPYTLQYVGTLPYLYYLKNIILWGLGPVISMLVVIGSWFMVWEQWLKNRKRISMNYELITKNRSLIVFFLFYLLYFGIVGRSAVKFMRYMLPLYPFFALLAGYGLYTMHNFQFSMFNIQIKNFKFQILLPLILLLAGLWTMSFMSIYFREHTRIAADTWIQKNVAYGSRIAVEHWDDRLPLNNSQLYTIDELTLYDLPDTEAKWQNMNDKLAHTDYLIIASNRLYTPLQKLHDCEKYKVCYPLTARYYQDLFSGRLNYEKVAEFSSYPSFQISNFKFQIPEDTADESFTVYDHPKIMIFKRK